MFGQSNQDKDTTPNNRNKPYLMLDDKYSTKTPKQAPTNGMAIKSAPKTTTNQDAKTFVFNNNKLVPAEQKKTKVIKPPTPTNKSKENNNNSLTTIDVSSTQYTPQAEKKPFIYYMTNMEKHQRNPNDYDYFCNIYREHFIQTYQAMMFCRYLRPVDPKVLGQKKVFLNKRETCKGKLREGGCMCDS